MTSKLTSDERLVKILSETQATIMEHNSRCVRGSVEVDARLFESMIMELQERRKAAIDGEPVAYIDKQWTLVYYIPPMSMGQKIGDKLYRHAQPAPVVPENCVTAEHRRVIEMLLNVCGAAFELADDSCQQDVDGEECHVVPSDAFQKLSDALDEIENTLPTEDIDRPDVFLAWSAMPRAALKSLLQAGNSPVIPDDSADTKRLDWLDAQNKRLNEYYGTSYGWKFDANFQRNAMMLNDSNYPVMTVRQAIDESIAAAPKQGNI